MSSPYITNADVEKLPGRLLALWNLQDSTIQQYFLDHVNDRIDQITGQDGGLLRQTGKTVTVWPDRNTDTIRLPNKPITNVESIWVDPRDGQMQQLLIVIGQPPPTKNTVFLTGGTTIRYRKITSVSPYFDPSPLPFNDGDLVTVTYDCGYATVPNPVTLAGLNLLGVYLLSFQDNPSGAFSISEDGAHIMFGGRQEILNPQEQVAEDLLSQYSIKTGQ